MKRYSLILATLLMSCCAFAQNMIIVGDMNGDGKLTVADVSMLTDDILTNHRVSLLSDGNFYTLYVQEYIDLGLPSGTLWATCNVGASSPEDCGNYYAWGETAPQDNLTYDWTSYSFCKGSSSTLTKYCQDSSRGYEGYTDELEELEAEDDIATVLWGTDWQIPSDNQISELLYSKFTTKTWTFRNGMSGYLITSNVKGYTDKSIFLPAAGMATDGEILEKSFNGHYWSRSLHPSRNYNAKELLFSAQEIDRSDAHRRRGFTIRPVRTGAKKAINYVEHEYVDLGLTSGTLWATCNVGADSPEKVGDYFAWGETEPKTDAGYSWKNYRLAKGSSSTLIKYCKDSSYGNNGLTDDLSELESADDAATANWGEDWQIPSESQLEELANKTTITWTTQNGVYGRLFTSRIAGYTDKSIFLPAGGYYEGSSLNEESSYGYYWSRSCSGKKANNSCYIGFGLDYILLSSNERYQGFNVRPVRVDKRK